MRCFHPPDNRLVSFFAGVGVLEAARQTEKGTVHQKNASYFNCIYNLRSLHFKCYVENLIFVESETRENCWHLLISLLVCL